MDNYSPDFFRQSEIEFERKCSQGIYSGFDKLAYYKRLHDLFADPRKQQEIKLKIDKLGNKYYA